MSPVFVQDADGCVVPAVVDPDGTPTEAFTAAVRKRRRPRVNLPDGPGVKDGKYTYHDPGTGRFAPYGFITPSKLKALLNPDARKRKEVLGELQDKLDDNDPLLAEYVRALRQGDKNRARQIAAAIRRAVIGDRPAAGDDRNAWDAGSREVAKLIPAAAKRADARGVHASNVPRNQIGMNPRVEAEAAAKERLAEMRNGGSLSVGRKVDFDEPEDAVDVNRPTAPGKVTAADVQPGDTVDGLRNVKGAHKVDAIRPDDSGAGYFIRLDGENEERFVHRDRLLTVTPGERTEPEPEPEAPDTDVPEVGADPQIERFRLADWEAIQPWKVERDPANPDPSALLLNGEPAPTWLKFSSALGTEAASHTDQAILLKPAFFALPTEESKRSALYHEAGHGLSDRMLEDQSAFDLVDDLPDFGHLNGQSTPGEVAAEAYSILWSEPSYLDEHAPGIRDAIIRKASEYGYPLPAGVRGTEPEPVDLIDTVEEQGGFTLDPRLGELVTRGIAVAVPGESAIIKADRFREDGEAERFIGDYIRKMRDDGLGDDVMIGAWYDREHDEIVLDRVQVFPDDQREEAIQAGRDRNEQAVYDLTNSNEIPTGGSGGREDINIIGGSDGDRTSEAVEGPDGRRDRPDDVPPGFQPATPDEVRDAARLNGTVRARVGNQGRMRRFAVGDEIEARYRDDEFADVWATTPEGKRRKYRVRWDRLDAFTDTDTSGARYGTSEQVKDAAAATDGPISARIADGRLHHLGLNAGDTIQVEYLNPHHGIVHVPTRDGGVRKYKVRWDRLDAHGGTAEQATPTAPEPRTPKKKSGPASQANRDAKKARLTALAEENGYSYEEIRDAERQVGQIKRAIRAEAKAAAYDALGQLELLGGSKLKRVAPKRQVTDARTGRKVWKRDAAGEWDWYEQIDPAEDRRLRSRWMVDGDDTTGGMNPDELAGWAFNAGLTPDDSIESGIGWYLEVTARIDAAESLGRGRLAPGTDRVNLDGLAPTTTGDARISVTDLFGPQSIDDQILAVAAASRDTNANRGLDEEYGYAMLGDTVHLPPDEQPWTFTRDDWGAEADRLADAATAPDATDDDLIALENHIPQGILDITTDDDDWGELYDWMAAAATAAGYDNVGTRRTASPEPEADRPKSRFSHPEGTPPPPAWTPPPREDRPEPPPEPEDGYRMEHRPDDTGPNAASIAGGESDDAEWSMPSDVLQYPERYTGASDMLDETVRQLRAVEGDPDGEVTIYRAAPPGAGIRPGDWVTMSRAYAEQHNESNVGDEGEITAITVPARDVKFAGDDLMEWGYWPSETAPDAPEPDAAPGGPAEGSPAARIAGAQPLPYLIAPTFDGRPQAADEDLVSEMRAAFESAPERLRVRVPPEVLGSLSTDGRWRTQFETGTTRGRIDFDQRRRVEDHRYGVAADHPDADRPVYGYVDDPTSDSDAAGYGDIVFHVKPEVAGRTTVVFGDSLIDNGASAWLGDPDPDLAAASTGIWNRYTPKPGDPTDEDIAERRREVLARLREAEPDTPEFDAARAELQAVLDVQESRKNQVYTEAQFHGGLTLDDLSGTVEYSPKAHTWDNRGDLITDGYDALDAMATAHPDLIREVTFRTPADDRLPADQALNPGDQMRAADLRRLSRQFAANHPGVTVNVSTAPNDPDTFDQIQVGVPVEAPIEPEAPATPGPSREGTMPRLPGESDADYRRRVVAAVLAEDAPEPEPEPPTLKPVSGPNPRPNGQAMPYELTPTLAPGFTEEDTDPADYSTEIERARAVADDAADRLRIRMPMEVLTSVFADGRIRTQFETGTSGGTNDPKLRAKAERNLFGVPGDLPPANRPVYGYVDDPDGAKLAAMYGDVVLHVKPEVAERTTATAGDSLYPGTDAHIAPIPLDEMAQADDLRLAQASAFTGGTDFYIEAQIHGGVNVDELDPVIDYSPTHFYTSSVDGGEARQVAAIRQLAAVARERGWKLRVQRPFAWGDRSTDGRLTDSDQRTYDQLAQMVADLGAEIELFNPDGSMPSDAPVEAPPAASTIAP